MSDDFEIHMNLPQNGTVIMVGESIELNASGVSTAGDVTDVTFLANGSSIGNVPNHLGGTIVASLVWTPIAVGEYEVQAVAQRGDGTAYALARRVCVLPFQIAPGHTIDTYARGYEGDCPIPDRSSSAIPGSPTLQSSVTPQSITYAPDFVDLCPDQTRIVQVDAWTDDPHDDVAFVTFAFQVLPALHSRLNSEGTLVLTRTTDYSRYAKHFQGQIDLHIFMARSLETSPTDPSTIDGQAGSLNWTIRAFGRDGTILLHYGPETIPVTPVNCDGTMPAAAPALTLIPSIIQPALSLTPASAKDCPPGTYFADITHRCIAIEVPPTSKPGSIDNSMSCSGYGDASTCTTNGCSWDKTKGTCN